MIETESKIRMSPETYTYIIVYICRILISSIEAHQGRIIF